MFEISLLLLISINIYCSAFFITKENSLARYAITVFFSVITFQWLGYLYLGYLDPFFLFASIVNFLISSVVFVILESVISASSGVKKHFLKNLYLYSFFIFLMSTPVFYTASLKIHEQLSFQRWVQSELIVLAEKAAKEEYFKIKKQHAVVTPECSLETKKNEYICIINNQNEVIHFYLSSPHLELIHFEVK